MDIKLLLVVVFFCALHAKISEEFYVNPTLVTSDPGAVCLTGEPASYYFAPGFDKGIHNWIVFLPGGGWCDTPEYCITYANGRNMTPYDFEFFLSSNVDQNPDFFDWNKAVIHYCDGSSFTGDSQTIYNGTQLYFRGARIYKAVMHELLLLGMDMAQNAILAGGSAGGVATTLHCDGFRNLLPYATRVKCLSDAGYFFPSRRFEGDMFTTFFQGLITLHGSSNSLPKSCTSRLSPELCFFAQNIQQDIKTPIFFLMSAFDTIQASLTFPNNKTIDDCIHGNICPSEVVKILQDLRREFLTLLPNQMSGSSRGVLITSPKVHEVTLLSWDWDMVIVGSNEKISKIFANWYFNERSVHIIDEYQYPCPDNCSLNRRIDCLPACRISFTAHYFVL